MVVFPNGKINLGLNITAKRADGYHDLETVFYPVKLRDALEVISADELTFTTSGLPVSGNPHDNLCMKAYHLLRTDYPSLPPIAVHLHKAIPMGAGLGGGSADGAFMLTLLNKEFHLNLSQEQLLAYALQLGSDCPFFIINTPCFATGRGEVLTPVALDLSAYKIVLVNPGIHVSTAAAFSMLTPAVPAMPVHEIVQQPIETWRRDLINDFEVSVFERHPELKAIKGQLYNAGALYAAMSGSGSTLFGFFKAEGFVVPAFAGEYSVFVV